MTVTAPGKLMLMGEHAVVYGQPCMVTAISARLTVSVKQGGDGIVIDAPDAGNTTFADAAIAHATKRWNLSYPGLRIKTKSSFSGKYGFGSSAAVSVALLTALAGEFGKTPSHEELFHMGLEVVRQVQGAASGFDIACAVWGGTLLYARQGEVVEDLSGFRECAFIVGYTGVKADTREIVAQVSKKREQDPAKVNRIFEAIGTLVGQGKDAYQQGEWKRLGTYMNFNQEYLRDLGVSTQKLEDLISAAKKAGAWGAKLSGAGGGDCMIAIAPMEAKETVEQSLKDAGGEVVQVRPHEEGVRVEESL